MAYLLIIGTVLLGLFSLHKDWHNYKHRWVRRGVPLVLVIVGALSIIKSYRDSRDAQTKNTKATAAINTLQAEVAGLQGQVKAANDAQTENTKIFLETLNRLSDKVGDLQNKITTEALRKQLASVQDDLQKTQKALAPAPKATLEFSFVPFINPSFRTEDKPSAVTDESVPVAADGTAHVEFTILNLSDVTAIDGAITLLICQGCKFANGPPPGFTRIISEAVAREPETNLTASFDRILPFTHTQTFAVDIVPPSNTPPVFEFGVYLRCRSCTLQKKPLKGTVHLLR